MPLLTISLSESIPDTVKETAVSEAVTIVAEETGKPKSVVMTKLEEECQLTIDDHSDKVALFELRGIEFPGEKMQSVTTRFCEWAEAYLSIPGNRVFIVADSVPRGYWGSNGKVF